MSEKYKGDIEKVFDFFNTNFEKYGYSTQSLGWIKGKQNIRFDALTRFWDLSKTFSILDIGCGFGDLNKLFEKKGITDYKYHGIDLVDGIIDTAKKIYSGKDNITFSVGDFLSDDLDGIKYDYIVASGIFNFKMKQIDNYENVERILKKAMNICKENGAVSFDFQSDKVDYYADNDVSFYNSPEKILSIAYKYSRNVILNNSYMPYEFSVTIFKNDSIEKPNLVFSKFYLENKDEFETGIYHEVLS